MLLTVVSGRPFAAQSTCRHARSVHRRPPSPTRSGGPGWPVVLPDPTAHAAIVELADIASAQGAFRPRILPISLTPFPATGSLPLWIASLPGRKRLAYREDVRDAKRSF